MQFHTLTLINMKVQFLFNTILLSMLVGLISCESEESISPTSLGENQFLLDNTIYDFHQGVVDVTKRSVDDSIQAEFILLGEGARFEDGVGLVGRGPLLIFELISIQDEETFDNYFNDGEYTYSKDPILYRLSQAALSLDFNIDEEQGTYSLVSNGTVTLQTREKKMNIDFDFTLEDGRKVKGNFNDEFIRF